MKLLSLNVGRPQEIMWNGRPVRTSIFKEAVADARQVSFLNIEGDEQSDLRVHGGANKAVYAYDVSHYQHWKKALARSDWRWGMFGENLTTDELPDDAVKIGDVYQIGSVHLQAVQPRFPCTKLNVRFGLPDMMERFINEKRNGIYFKVLQQGALKAGDQISLLQPSAFAVTVQQYVNCYYAKGKDKALVDTILSIPFLPESQRGAFESFR
jgi:MOSC domain-containing protein YiiM